MKGHTWVSGSDNKDLMVLVGGTDYCLTMMNVGSPSV